MTEPTLQPSWGLRFHNRRVFAWKTLVLLVATFAAVPVLLYQSRLGAELYVGFLVAVHVVGLATFLVGVKRHHIAPTRRGLVGRVAGLLVAVALLYLAEKGLHNEVGSLVFWWGLFGVWAIHTAGLALLHVRSSSEENACPFA